MVSDFEDVGAKVVFTKPVEQIPLIFAVRVTCEEQARLVEAKLEKNGSVSAVLAPSEEVSLHVVGYGDFAMRLLLQRHYVGWRWQVRHCGVQFLDPGVSWVPRGVVAAIDR